MRPLDMFLSRNEPSPFGNCILIPNALPKGKAYSPHLISLSALFSPLREEGFSRIKATKAEVSAPAPFDVPIEDASHPILPFTTKRLPESSPADLSPDLQIAKTKRIIGMEQEFLRQPEIRQLSEKRIFFRNIRNMLSLGIVFLGSLLLTGATNTVILTYAQIQETAKEMSTTLPKNPAEAGGFLTELQSLSHSASFFLLHNSSRA
ncbi:MAG: hypothetical protein WCJ84_00805 [Candidatus Peregrinibacteria bacterium]